MEKSKKNTIIGTLIKFGEPMASGHIYNKDSLLKDLPEQIFCQLDSDIYNLNTNFSKVIAKGYPVLTDKGIDLNVEMLSTPTASQFIIPKNKFWKKFFKKDWTKKYFKFVYNLIKKENLLVNLISNETIGIASRGYGVVGNEKIVRNFELTGFDLIVKAPPSNTISYVGMKLDPLYYLSSLGNQ